jgi:hypothetical protein
MNKVNVMPTESFHHNEFTAKKGVELKNVPIVQARLLKAAGLVKDFDEGADVSDDTLAADAEAARARASEQKKADAPENKMAAQPANKAKGR